MFRFFQKKTKIEKSNRTCKNQTFFFCQYSTTTTTSVRHLFSLPFIFHQHLPSIFPSTFLYQNYNNQPKPKLNCNYLTERFGVLSAIKKRFICSLGSKIFHSHSLIWSKKKTVSLLMFISVFFFFVNNNF